LVVSELLLTFEGVYPPGAIPRYKNPPSLCIGVGAAWMYLLQFLLSNLKKILKKIPAQLFVLKK
jgi:hypothetical protein